LNIQRRAWRVNQKDPDRWFDGRRLKMSFFFTKSVKSKFNIEMGILPSVGQGRRKGLSDSFTISSLAKDFEPNRFFVRDKKIYDIDFLGKRKMNGFQNGVGIIFDCYQEA
jgi:hypothetical protein